MDEMNAYNPRFSSYKKRQKSGKNASTILQDNRNLILELIYESKSISRKQLAEKTGLQLATVTIIIKELLAQGLICESGRIDGGNGRSVQSFSVVENLYVLAVRITAVYIKVVLYDVNLDGKYVKKVFFKTDDTIQESKDIIIDSIKELEGIYGRRNILAIAIGVEHRYRLSGDDYAVWDKKREEYCFIGKEIHDLTRYLVFTNRAINYSTYHLNKYCASAVGQMVFHVLINITVSYELESALIIDNEIIYGKNGRCGQMKDIRLSHSGDKAYKDVLTVSAIINRAKEMITDYPDSVLNSIEELNIRDIIRGYNNEDPLCLKVYDEVCFHLGYAIAELLKWLDPDMVVIGDEIPASEMFVKNLRKYVSEFADESFAKRVSCIIKDRVTENDPALLGAADFAFNKIIGEIGLELNLLNEE